MLRKARIRCLDALRSLLPSSAEAIRRAQDTAKETDMQDKSSGRIEGAATTTDGWRIVIKHFMFYSPRSPQNPIFYLSAIKAD